MSANVTATISALFAIKPNGTILSLETLMNFLNTNLKNATNDINKEYFMDDTLLLTLNCTDSMGKCTDQGFIYKFPLSFKVFWYVCYGLISVLATLGNGLVIWVILGSRRMRNVTNYYIANLAIADFTLAIFVIPFEFQSALDQRWNLPNFMCSFCPFIQSLTINVSIYTLTAIAIDRQRVILNPFARRSTKGICQLVILSIWIVSIIMSFPLGYAMGIDEDSEELPFCYPVRIGDEGLSFYRMIIMIMQYVIPLMVIGWAYATIALALWGNHAPGNAQTNRDRALMQTKKRVIKMLVLVVALFGLCWLPLHTYQILYHIFPNLKKFKYINVVFFCIDWFAMSNACYNPFIYAIYNEKFKHEFKIRMEKLKLRRANKNELSRRRRDRNTFFSYDWRSLSRRSKMNSRTMATTHIKESLSSSV